MAIKVIRDADNKWQTYIDWTNWVASKAKVSPNGPGLTAVLVSAAWDIPAALTEESTTLSGNLTHFVGSGGTNGTDYDLVCRITWSCAELSLADLTQDQTITVRLQDQ